MENTLNTLFDFQKYHVNFRLQKLIDDTQARYAAALGKRAEKSMRTNGFSIVSQSTGNMRERFFQSELDENELSMVNAAGDLAAMDNQIKKEEDLLNE